MKTSLLRSVLLAMPLSLHCLAQETLILQPDAAAGKDAVLHGLATEANNNWGSTNQFPAAAWTFQGSEGTLRTAIDFDLSSIPTGSTVVSAYLSLYAFDADNGFGFHSTLSGSNAGWLQRITTAWNENTVTWNTQPNSTSVNQVATPQLNTPTANIIDLDVSQLVQDMVNDPGNSHGFLLRLQNETIYRRLNFASSDHANNALHPRLIVTYLEPIASDSCFTLQPGAAAGKDAVLHGLVSEANNNWGSSDQFPAAAWTFQSVAGTLRSAVGFDLSQVPSDAVITSAYLSLYAYDADIGFGLHSTLSGSNAAWIRRITTPWNEGTVTWNTQPTATNTDQVLVPLIDDPQASLLDADVTALVQAMVDDPTNSHGFLLRLQDETYYRRLNFASSDHVNPALWPRLDVCYQSTSAIQTASGPASSVLHLFPNPAMSEVTVDLGTRAAGESVEVQVVDPSGRSTLRFTMRTISARIDLSGLAPGSYVVRANTSTGLLTSPLVVVK